MCDLLKKKGNSKLDNERLAKEVSDGGYADGVVKKVLGDTKKKDYAKEVLGR